MRLTIHIDDRQLAEIQRLTRLVRFAEASPEIIATLAASSGMAREIETLRIIAEVFETTEREHATDHAAT